MSPHVEMVCRRIYWSNIKWLSKTVKKQSKSRVPALALSFDKVEDFLRDNGLMNGSLAVVHSAYAPFKGRGKTPDEIVDMLLKVVGCEGTLAMPAAPKFKNSIDVEDYLKAKNDENLYVYDVQKSLIKTGVIPLMLHRRKNSIRSRHPINSMVAFGPLAEAMMKNNLSGNSPLACGANSSWKYCVDNDAIIVGLGTDLTHSLTMIHVAEDVLDERWPIKNWYVDKNFLILDDNYENKIKLRERAPHWGALHYGERTLCKDLINAGVLNTTIIDGITVEALKARDLMDFLNKRNGNGYPYFWVRTCRQ